MPTLQFLQMQMSCSLKPFEHPPNSHRTWVRLAPRSPKPNGLLLAIRIKTRHSDTDAGGQNKIAAADNSLIYRGEPAAKKEKMRSNVWRLWWKPWTWSTRTWVCVILLAIVVGPFINRWIWLWQITDVRLPFDPAAMIEPESGDESAIAVYANVANMLTSQRPANTNSTTALAAMAPQDRYAKLLTQMPAHNPQALAEYLRAGTLTHSGGVSVRTATVSTLIPEYQMLRQLARVYLGVADDVEATGELEQAWAIHCASLQLSIHAERCGLAICKLIGCAIRNSEYEGLLRWASNPAVTSEQLRTARADIARELARRISMADCFKAEYLMFGNTFNTPDGTIFFFLDSNVAAEPKPALLARRVILWFNGQPELAQRTWRQLLANLVPEIDKTLSECAPSDEFNGLAIFELDSKVPRAPGQLDAASLATILKSQHPLLRLNQRVMPSSMMQVRVGHLRDSARYEAVMIAFAAQDFHRQKGHYPATIDQLVPTYLDRIPQDPMNPKGGAMNYRREADGTAIVWSVGDNWTDHQGDIHSNPPLDLGYDIKLILPDVQAPADALVPANPFQ